MGKLGRLPGDGIEKGPFEDAETSSNRSSTTTFGSVRLRINDLLIEGVRLAKLCVRDLTLVGPPLGGRVSAYSGRSEKLSGVTTTPKVPGRGVSAFRSLSSSVVSAAKAGKSSKC